MRVVLFSSLEIKISPVPLICRLWRWPMKDWNFVVLTNSIQFCILSVDEIFRASS